jgi:hypothetical protein
MNNLELELATTGQIAEELKKRGDPFVLIVSKPGHHDTVNMGMFALGSPLLTLEILEQGVEIMRKVCDEQ